MGSSLRPFLLLLALSTMDIYAQTKGVELSVHRQQFISSPDDACGQLTCVSKGNAVTIDTVTLSRVKDTGESIQLLVVSASEPSMEVVIDNIRGNGTLEKNTAIIRLNLFKSAVCDSDHFTCRVTFVDRSGRRGSTFTTVGAGQPQGMEPAVGRTVRDPVPGYGSCTSPSNLFVTEVGYLGDKVTKVERKLQTLGDRLEDELSQKVDAMDGRVRAQEKTLLDRVGSVETGLYLRVSRLEDRAASLLLSQPAAGAEPEVVESAEELQETLAEMSARIDAVSASLVALQGDRNVAGQPVTCERGMGDDVTRTYPPYVIMANNVTKKQVLCDTHTDGGGWIVIQRRAKGDVDFYRDWTAYREGFGSPTGDFWIGNEAIHQLTDSEAYELRVDIRYKGQELFAEYSSFRIENESNKYRLVLGQYVGTAGDALSAHNGYFFTTFDRDNDDHPTNCALHHHGAWWYTKCADSTLNSRWGAKDRTGPIWDWSKGSGQDPVSFSEMKIRRVGSV